MPLPARFFRHEYGRLVAVLTRRVGVRRLDAVEDAVQRALLAALESWPRSAVPENPPAWLFRVAHNHLVEELRRRARQGRLAERYGAGPLGAAEAPPAFLAGEVPDDLLRMLFVCCDEAIPVESQLVLALKTLCGFEAHEIAERFFTSEAHVYKRLGRARARLRSAPLGLDDAAPGRLGARLPAVHAVLYLLFTEGHLSSHPDRALRRELCDEALRLARLLAEHPVGATPETFALLALMHLHLARMAAREDGAGGLLLLEEQDRSRWGGEEIEQGLAWLARSAAGDSFSRYHAEAGIAAEHCLAPSLAETRWDRIARSYALLERLAPSPSLSTMHRLNRAIATAEWLGPEEGLALIEGLEPPQRVAGSYLWEAVLADLHGRCGHAEIARRHRDAAIGSAPSPAVRAALERRLGPALGAHR